MGRLVLSRRSGMLVYTLEGIHVGVGAPLEVRMPSGAWVCGRLAWDGDAYHPPTLDLAMVDQEIAMEITVRLPSDAELRWPARRQRVAAPLGRHGVLTVSG